MIYTFNILFSMQILGCKRIFTNFKFFLFEWNIYEEIQQLFRWAIWLTELVFVCPVAFIFSSDLLFHYDFLKITFPYFCRDIDLCSVKMFLCRYSTKITFLSSHFCLASFWYKIWWNMTALNIFAVKGWNIDQSLPPLCRVINFELPILKKKDRSYVLN